MDWKESCREKALKLTKKKRQEFLDLMRGGKSVKEAYTECKITFDEACGILDLNIKEVHYHYLSPETI